MAQRLKAELNITSNLDDTESVCLEYLIKAPSSLIDNIPHNILKTIVFLELRIA